MERLNYIFSASLLITGTSGVAQDTLLLAYDEFHISKEEFTDDDEIFGVYDHFNPVILADSVRLCGGHPCTGWVEDEHANGKLKHRGYYDDGRLSVYKNYHANGELEREFKSIDARKSVMRMYHRNGNVRSITNYNQGVAVEYKDHYMNGQLRYHEERHRTEPYYLRMDLYASNGDPVSLHQVANKKKAEFLLREFYPGGILRVEGKARYNPSRMDSQRIGEWKTYSKEGELLKVEVYQNGKIASVR